MKENTDSCSKVKLRKEKEDVFAIKGPGGKNSLVTKIPIPTSDSAKKKVNKLQLSSLTNKLKQSFKNTVSPQQSKKSKRSLDQMIEVETNPKHAKVLLLDSTTRNEDVKTSNDIPKSMSSLQKSRESISMQVDSPKISESNEDDQFVDGDEAKRKFNCEHCYFTSSSRIKFDRHKNSRHIMHIDTIEDSNRPLIRKEGEWTGLSKEIKKEIVTNPHQIGFNEDNAIVIDY